MNATPWEGREVAVPPPGGSYKGRGDSESEDIVPPETGSSVPTEMAGLGLLNPVVSAKEKYLIFQRGSAELIRAMMGVYLQVKLLPRGTKRKPVIHRLSQQRHHYITC